MLQKTPKKQLTTIEKTAEALKQTAITIKPPNFQSAKVRIVGTTPYVGNKMSARARAKMMADQELGDQKKKNRKKEPKNFQEVYEGAKHVSTDGWLGMPASAFRTAMVSACKVCGFQMTRAKLSLFVDADGFDEDDGQPLIRIYGEPRRLDMVVRLANGAPDILPRPIWEKWHADILLRWDADQFSGGDVINLLARVGMQVGIGAGRPDSRSSCGMGWGLFRVET